MRILVDYRCSECGAAKVKLWRQYSTFLEKVNLLCLSCAEQDQNRRIDLGRLPEDEKDENWKRPSDQIGWLVPAIPCDGEATFWGYTSTPNSALIWWHLLPTFREDDFRELEWLRAWSHANLRELMYYQGRELERLGIKVD